MKVYKHGKIRMLAALMALLLCIVSMPMTSITASASVSGNDASSKWTDHAATAFAGGTGTEADPWQIATAAQLALVAKDQTTYSKAGLYFKLTDNIDLSAYEWVPIDALRGTFDGNGKSVTGLRIGTAAAPATDLQDKNVGLFGKAVGKGYIKDITVNAQIYVSDTSDWEGAAIIVGQLQGKAENCIAEGTINVARKYAYVGGIAGYVDNGANILNCGNKAAVSGNGDATIKNVTRVGGIAGALVVGGSQTKSLLVANNYNVGTITATGGNNPFAGGIAGYLEDNNDTYQIDMYNCYNAGMVNVTGYTTNKGEIGNIFGYYKVLPNGQYLYGVSDTLSTNDFVKKVVNAGQTDMALTDMQTADFVTTLNANVSALTNTVSGLMNWTTVTGGTPILTAEDVQPVPETANLTINVTGTEFGTATVAVSADGGNSYADATGTSPYVIAKGSSVKVTFTPNADCETVIAPEGSEEQADGSYVYTINSFTEDTALAVEFKGAESKYWTDHAATAFAGGTGTEADPWQIATAAQLALVAKDQTTYSKAGLYFKLTDNIDLSAYEWVPIDALRGTFDGNGKSVTGLRIGTAAAPATNLQGKNVGLFGKAVGNGYIKNLTVNAQIYVSDTSNWEAAGIVVGNLGGKLDNCFAEGIINVTRKCAYVGGIAGHLEYGGRILNCGNKAAVYGSGDTTAANKTRVGGIAGSLVIGASHNKNLFVANCYNVGSITATGGHTPYAGGVFGYIQNTSNDQSTYQVSIYNCYNAGNVEITGYTTAKGKVGNIAATTTGTVNTMYLYGVSDTLSTGDYASAVNKCTDQTDKPLSEMQTEGFADGLTLNADILVGNGICEKGLLGWKVEANNTPTFTNTLVQGTLTTLNVTVNSSRLGSVTIKADQAGGDNYVEVTKLVLEKGSKVQLTLLPEAGCAVTALTVNGSEETVTENTFEFTLAEATEIEVAFEVINTVDVNSIYVNPSAIENGTGTEVSPFKTLEQAKAKIRTILEETPNANITIYLMGGTYLLEETFELSEADTSLGRITYKNYNDETPVITSGHAISGGFIKVEGKEYYSYQLPESAKVGAEGSKTWPQFRDLLVDGERATIARTEELIYKHTYANSVYGSATSATTVVSCDNLLYVSPDALAGINSTNVAGVELGQLVEWKSQIFHIGSITGNTLDGEIEITIDPEEWELFYATDSTKKSLVGRGYWLQNHINFLDAPGEFYYDQSKGTIYYYPLIGQDMSSATIEYVTLDTLINMENAANITFDGIRFTGTTANYITENGFAAALGCTLRYYAGDEGQNVPFAAIKANMTEGIQVQNCRFEELGGPAMVFNFGIKDLQITGNIIKDIAMAGIQVGRNQVWWNEGGILGSSEDVTISNNYITNVGTLVPGAPAIKVARSKNLNIQHNKIVHVPYSAIMAGYGFNVSPTYEERNTNLINADISYNYIEDYLYKINDGGGIYTCGPNGFITDTSYKNEIHHNYIRAGAHNVTYTGIYHDGSASNWRTHDNVIDDLKSRKSPMFFQDDVPTQYTHNILAENNYTTASIIVQNGTTDANGKSRNIVLQNNTMFKDRSKLSAEAIAIMNGAGLQDAYKHLETPMDVELRIADNTMHYEVNKKQEGNTSMQIELTNNSTVDQVFILYITGTLPAGIDLIINGGNNVSVEAGETKIVNAEFIITDVDKVVDTEDSVVGFEVMDAAGRVIPYPRIFTIKTLSGNVAGEIPYGTPTVDGILDEAYLEGTRNFFGPVFHPDTYTETDISGGYYLLWDENYLYCYVIVNESTVMSRGTEWIAEQIAAGQQGNLWATDAVETYIKVPSIRSGQSKFAVDAFGIERFGNANISLDHHNYLPYATKFTYNDEIINKEIPEIIAAGQTATEAMGTQVTGYVVEMTLPITLLESVITSDDGVPSAGDSVDFYIQNNDYRGLKPDGSIYTVANANTMSAYTLKAKEEETTPIEVEVNNIGAVTSGAVVDEPEDGWVEGTNTFTVSGGDACVVAVKNADGTYTRLSKDTASSGGVYSYTVENVTAETEIVVALSGDANGDGKVSNADITKLRAACAGKATLDGIQTLLGDVNGNGEVTNADITRLRAACAGKKALDW